MRQPQSTSPRGEPIEILDEVVIAGGEPALHRAWPAEEILPNGDLVVAHKEGLDHHRTKDAALFVACSIDGGRSRVRAADNVAFDESDAGVGAVG